MEIVEYKRVKIKITEGDITDFDVDAIVNPANSKLSMGGGVAGAIRAKGGREIEEEAMSRAPVPVGSAIYTTAGRLKAKLVIHAPTMREPGIRTTISNVKKATSAALRLADKLALKTVALPAMGAGVGGLDPYNAVKAMLETIKDEIDKGIRLSEVILVAYGDDSYERFRRALADSRDLFRS